LVAAGANIADYDPQRFVRHWRAALIGRMSAFGICLAPSEPVDRRNRPARGKCRSAS
jgi:hypothetical protein